MLSHGFHPSCNFERTIVLAKTETSLVYAPYIKVVECSTSQLVGQVSAFKLCSTTNLKERSLYRALGILPVGHISGDRAALRPPYLSA